jgi:hypothetical protein
MGLADEVLKESGKALLVGTAGAGSLFGILGAAWFEHSAVPMKCAGLSVHLCRELRVPLVGTVTSREQAAILLGPIAAVAVFLVALIVLISNSRSSG